MATITHTHTQVVYLVTHIWVPAGSGTHSITTVKLLTHNLTICLSLPLQSSVSFTRPLAHTRSRERREKPT